MAHDGRTVLFVSHNITAIQSLCPRAILLQGGKVAADGRVGAEIAGPRRTTRWWFEPGRLGARVEVVEDGRTRAREIGPGASPLENITD